MFDLDAIERASVRAWPALETQAISGWTWRFSSGGSQRANSVAALGSPGRELDAAITEVERLYAERGAPAQFQVTDASQPATLDARLAARGYRINDVCTTLAAALDPALSLPRDAHVSDRVSGAWFETYASVISPSRRAVAPQILARVPETSAFCGIVRGGRMLATTLVVLDGPIAIVECVATVPDARRTGAAKSAMLSAMAWAADRGARVMGLGAVAANTPAQRLYATLGFSRIGGYHMRIRES